MLTIFEIKTWQCYIISGRHFVTSSSQYQCVKTLILEYHSGLYRWLITSTLTIWNQDVVLIESHIRILIAYEHCHPSVWRDTLRVNTHRQTRGRTTMNDTQPNGAMTKSRVNMTKQVKYYATWKLRVLVEVSTSGTKQSWWVKDGCMHSAQKVSYPMVVVRWIELSLWPGDDLKLTLGKTMG